MNALREAPDCNVISNDHNDTVKLSDQEEEGNVEKVRDMEGPSVEQAVRLSLGRRETRVSRLERQHRQFVT